MREEMTGTELKKVNFLIPSSRGSMPHNREINGVRRSGFCWTGSAAALVVAHAG
jgi:hypothetical protein